MCVVTGVSSIHSPAFVVAQELALTAGMHVILVGRANLATCQQTIRQQAKTRQIPVKLFAAPKMHLASLDSIRQAADYIIHLAHLKYQGRCQLVVNMAHVGTNEPRLTQDGLEYNTGCNLVGTQYFTKLLLPLVSRAAPHGRIIHASSMGHCLGTNFNPQRFVDHPAEGGAPPGFLQQTIRQHDLATNLLVSDEVLQINQVEASYTVEQRRQAVQKQGTQVGRSKMALMATTHYMSRLYPDISFFTFHLIPPPSRSSWFPRNSNNSHHDCLAAMPALRAALDDELCPNLYNPPQCYYLHGDGSIWTPMEPAQDNVFAKACYVACEQVLQQVIPTNGGQVNPPGDVFAYRPPQI
jgi:NAD(P)-dependent dehydrogenase (short-subunit alcohol dehydrogenase family)